MSKISYAGYRFPPVIIQQAVWLYARFTLSFRDVEGLLAERGIMVSYETVRRWVRYFGPTMAADLRRRLPKPHSTWHLDEVFIRIDGRLVYLWRAVDAEGEVLDVVVQSKRDERAALKLLRKLLKKMAFVPDKLVTDDLRSYGAAARELGLSRRHERGRWRNNRAENSHQPPRRRISGDLTRSLAVLVAATPCPLILAAPVAFIAGVAQAARRGILVKGGGPLEALARSHTVLFDKTGTLTVGGARLLSVEAAPGENADEILMLGASLEQASHHVIANAIVQAAAERGLKLELPERVRESMGSGLEGVIGGRHVIAGAREMVFTDGRTSDWATRAIRRASWRSALIVFIAVDGRPAGALLLADELRADTPRAIRLLREAGIARILMVTGDRAAAAQAIGAALDLDGVLAERVPSDKVDAVRSEQRLHPTIMVGDGINDAPALAAADVGIALGARGASASSEAADVVILADRLDRVGEAIVIARRARHIAIQSIVVC